MKKTVSKRGENSKKPSAKLKDLALRTAGSVKGGKLSVGGGGDPTERAADASSSSVISKGP